MAQTTNKMSFIVTVQSGSRRGISVSASNMSDKQINFGKNYASAEDLAQFIGETVADKLSELSGHPKHEEK